MFLRIIAIISVFCGVKGSLDSQCKVPMLNRYNPSIIPIETIPEEINYEEPQCYLVGSFVTTILDDYHVRGLLTDTELSKSHEALLGCKSVICDDQEMKKKLEEPMVAAELASLTVSRGKVFDPAYGVFEYLIDPFYWEIMADVPYPIVEKQHFGVQKEAAFEIISKVCGHQKPTLKEDIYPETIKEIFIAILVKSYIPYSFADGLHDLLIKETDATNLRNLWGLAALKREANDICLDYTLTNDEERTTISTIRDIAESLGVTCAKEEDYTLEYSFEYAAMAPPPMGPDMTIRPAPGSPSGPSGAAPPSGGSTQNSFAPGASG